MVTIKIDDEVFVEGWREKSASKNRPLAKLPHLGDILYVRPTPGNRGRKCSNCIMWVKTNQCAIHRKSLKITGDMVCGYHVFGKPMPKWMTHPGIQAVDEEVSGLILGPREGTLCKNCVHYGGGKCYAVVDNRNQPAKVEAYGCCARWKAL